ncbi:MAG: class I SAM-dependent methyltransferase [Candidatus Omnitrophica bacterium]|nr:class I SAM-dependent methyltransferase [Candidatus Omnitrophota bacterium]
MCNSYWNSLAENYTDQVLEIANYDISGVLKEEIKFISKNADTVADLGCGPGKTLELLSPHFKNVKAVDYAADLLKRAQKRYNFRNVEYIKHNLTSTRSIGFKTDAVFCVNVMISPVFEQRKRIAKKVWQTTKKNGLSVFVVPSFESILHVYNTLLNYQIRFGVKRNKSVADLERVFKKEVISVVDGIVSIGGTPTKCYTKEKLESFISSIGFEPIRTRKIEFSWEEEMENVPQKIAEPYPWDWFLLAQKK